MVKISSARITQLAVTGLPALLFSLAYVYSPWPTIVGESKFTDFEAYLSNIDALINDAADDLDGVGLVQIILSEPLWRFILLSIGSVLDTPANGLSFVSLLCIFVYSLFLFSRINIFLASVFLLNPLVIDLVLSQIRSALAMALCLAALMIMSRLLGLILLIAASLIHTATFSIVATYFAAKILSKMQKTTGYNNSVVVAWVLALLAAVLLSYGRETILGAVGDRRAEYDVGAGTVFYVAYWALLTLALSFTRGRYRYVDEWMNYYSIIMLSVPFFMTLFSTNGLRFLALSFPAMLCALFARASPIREILIGSLFCYQLLQYAYWL